MKYDFDKVLDRRDTSSLKWDYLDKRFGSREVLPMWVADMDFAAPPAVIEALVKRAEHGIYGYTGRSRAFYDAIAGWMAKRHGWNIDSDWIAGCSGVVPAVNLCILTYTRPGDKILMQTPTYYPFFSSIESNDRVLAANELKLEGHRYVMDFEDLEEKLASGVKMMILCNPHNPVGRVWSREELQRVGELCLKYHVLIVADEIHSDLIYKGYRHIPFASLSKAFADSSITCIAPSKTFNTAGLLTAAVIIPDRALLRSFNRTVEQIGIDTGNIFGSKALEAAYTHGEEWLEALLAYLEENLDFLMDYFERHIPAIKPIRPEGTYLVWLDCRGLGYGRRELREFMIRRAKVGLNDGGTFGPTGEGFMRINIACPRSLLEEGLKRIEAALRE